MTQELILRAPEPLAANSPVAPGVVPHPLPTHLAVILDGNRRWADRLGVPAAEGYRAGGRNVHALLSWCEEAGIPFVTLWPLSTENLGRDAGELRDLLAVIADVFDELAASGRWRLHVIGDLTKLPRATAERIGTDIDAMRAAAEKSLPVRRGGVPADIANAVAFFAAEESGYVTGQVLYIDGGRGLI